MPQQRPELIALKFLRTSAVPFIIGTLLFIFVNLIFYAVFSASINRVPNPSNLNIFNNTQSTSGPYGSLVSNEANKYGTVASLIFVILAVGVIGYLLAMVLIESFNQWHDRVSTGFKILKSTGYKVDQGRLGAHAIFAAMLIYSASFPVFLLYSIFNPHIVGPISATTYYLITLSPIFQFIYISPYMLVNIIALITALVGSIPLAITYRRLFTNKFIRAGSVLTILGFAIGLVIAIIGGLILVIAFILIYAGLRKVEYRLKPASEPLPPPQSRSFSRGHRLRGIVAGILMLLSLLALGYALITHAAIPMVFSFITALAALALRPR